MMHMKRNNSRIPYTCCRCGYNTHDKTCMRYHLYTRKVKCPPQVDQIELTDAIKDSIMNERMFKLPFVAPAVAVVQNVKINNQQINNFHTMNNLISNMDPLLKLKEYANYKKLDMMPFDRDIELKYEKKRARLENNTFIEENHNEDIDDIIDRISKCNENDLSDFNILYDKDMNKVIIYESGDWQELLASKGVQTIIQTIKDYFWDAYECFLIRNIEKGEREMRMRDLLEKHFRFLACVDVDPYIAGKPDNKIMFNADDDEYWDEPDFQNADAHVMQDRYMPQYRTAMQALGKRDKDEAKKLVIDIIKRNTRKCLMNLNKVIISFMDADEQFKNSILAC